MLVLLKFQYCLYQTYIPNIEKQDKQNNNFANFLVRVQHVLRYSWWCLHTVICGVMSGEHGTSSIMVDSYDDEGSRDVWNVGIFLPKCMALHSRVQHSSHTTTFLTQNAQKNICT